MVCANCGERAPAGAQFCPACSAPLPAAASAEADVRKVVTVLFCDVVGSTALGERLDPEALRTVIGRYFEEMRGAIERHGGTVEKFIGDAVMGVFGVPVVHEDDALRGVRAAVEMRERLRLLNEELVHERGVRVEARIGLNTGEVVAGESSDRQRLVTGDTVNVAKRLEEAADVDEILVGDLTRRLVQDAVELEPAGRRPVKGKAAELDVWRVGALVPGSPPVPARIDSPLVGRAFELAQLRHAYEQVALERRCRLVTVLGPAGIGKSRLAAELAAAVEDEATVLTGRCLPYGDGITFWPLAEIVRQVGGEQGVEGALAGSADAGLVAERLLAAVGRSASVVGGQETFWAVRAFFEAVARDRPLVIVLEDIHWAEPTFLDVIEYLVESSGPAPILLLCLARPELLDARPGWTTPRPNGSVLVLKPLSAGDAHTLLAVVSDERLDAATRVRIAEAAEGNPLYVEQMVAMVDEAGPDAAGAVPPTIQALLSARLERLDAPERTVIERAAVVGREFAASAVADLSPPDLRPAVAGHLMALVRRGLVRAGRSDATFGDAFRFQHVLVRDAAYERMPKELRGELHERFAGWIVENGGEQAAELDEIVGYHLEQAFRYREQLRPADERGRALATRAGELLGSAGRRAFARDDVPAAIKLLDRALALLTNEHPVRLELVRELSGAFWAVGEVARAEALLTGVIEAAGAAGDRRQEWLALLDRAQRRAVVDADSSLSDLDDAARRALAVFDELGDDAGLARAWRALAQVARRSCRFDEAQQHSERALRHARRAGARREEARIVDALCTALLYGPARVEEALARSDVLLEESRGNRLAVASVLSSRAGLLGMRGSFDEARDAVAGARRVYEDLGLLLPLAGLTSITGEIELLAGDASAAERALREGYDFFRDHGAPAFAAAQAPLLARALAALGRDADALAVVAHAERDAPPEDLPTQVQWRSVRSPLDAAGGQEEAALELADEAVSLSAETDALTLRAYAHLALADVRSRLGLARESEASRREAVRLLEEKGNLAARRTVMPGVATS